MSFAREKRLWLGALALLAALPLPFNDMLEWLVLALYALLIAQFLRRSWEGSQRWLPDWALNLLGLGYLPVLVGDFALYGRAQLVRPVVHLILFGVTAKLWSLRRERDKWQTFIGVFFLFLAAMATSVHPSILVYLAVFLVLTMATLMRFAYLHLLASFGHRELPPVAVPMRGFLSGAALLTLVCAIPLFAFLPRVRSPFILGPGGMEPRSFESGFSDEMSLDLIGRIRSNRAVALRLAVEGRTPPPGLMRFKAATYDVFEGLSWRRSPTAGFVPRDTDGAFRLAVGERVGEARVYLEPLRATSLVLPVEALRVRLKKTAIQLDQGGAAFLRGMPSEILEYSVELAPRPRLLGAAPAASAADPTLDPSGVTSPIADLAHRFAGSGSPVQKAERIEQRLLDDYEYTDELLGRGGTLPIENFLLRGRRGHCEYFASAMVLLLRAEGIPARLVTGFLGAEYSFWEELYVVRQSNAHAWVEAYLPGEGWRTFDPTPPSGRPEIPTANVWLYARQAWALVVFRWDRYVLSYDFYDQIRALGAMRQLWEQFMRQLLGPEPTLEPDSPAPPEAPGALGPEGTAARESSRLRPWLLALAGLVILGSAALWLVRRPRWSATLAYRLLRDRLASAGLRTPASLAPVALARAAAGRFPEAASPAHGVVRYYLRESFAGEGLTADEISAARGLLGELDVALRRARRRRRTTTTRR